MSRNPPSTNVPSGETSDAEHALADQMSALSVAYARGDDITEDADGGLSVQMKALKIAAVRWDVRRQLLAFLQFFQDDAGGEVECVWKSNGWDELEVTRVSWRHPRYPPRKDFLLHHRDDAWDAIQRCIPETIESGKVYKVQVDDVLKGIQSKASDRR